MYEFDSVSVSTYDASSLTGKLGAKSADGWEVVGIVPAGSDIIAFLKREAAAEAATSSTDAAVAGVVAGAAATDTPAADTAAAGTKEPSGWGSAPAAAAGAAGAAAGSNWGGATASEDTGSSWGASGTPATETSGGWGSGAAPAAAVAAAAPAQPATPSVPAGWYHDPAGRYELRYWDGTAWTEHVSRAGQQYTDPPVA
jgi:Protein of unknown function (DUF2510)